MENPSAGSGQAERGHGTQRNIFFELLRIYPQITMRNKLVDRSSPVPTTDKTDAKNEYISRIIMLRNRYVQKR